jgi:UDP-N-acetylmuramoyl-tripeptide--D-alanyl-D-alanine ligase
VRYTTLHELFLSCEKVSTDTRNITPGCLFFALKGPTFNANDFVLKALDEGAAYAVADEARDEFEGDERVIVVGNSLQALQDLAREHRRKLKIPIIGLTGSNGKTTSKELLQAALSTQYATYATKGNLNNHIGVPLSLLEITKDHEVAIIEMGANHQREIDFLCSISMPDLGFITNIGLAHLEGFGGEEGVFLGKKELFDHLILEGNKLFINGDDPKVVRAAAGHSGVYYGRESSCHFQGSSQMQDNQLTVNWWRDIDPFKRVIRTQLSGSYNFSNVMAAVAISRYYGVPDDKIKKGIEAYKPSNNRSQIEHSKRGNTLIVDCYNANPSSMLAAIENLSLDQASHRIAIVGDMLELGSAAAEKHAEIVQLLTKKGISAILVGELFGQVPPHAFKHFETTQMLVDFLEQNPIVHSTVLLKGSRKMKLEQLLELL